MKFFELLEVALSDTLDVMDPKSDAYKIWWTSSNSPIPPGIERPDGNGFYPTTSAALTALKKISDGFLSSKDDLSRSISKDTAYKVVVKTFGASLEALLDSLSQHHQKYGNDVGWAQCTAWPMFRQEFEISLLSKKAKITHYIPVWIVVRQESPDFNIGPIEFLSREAWCSKIEAIKGKPLEARETIEAAWENGISQEALEQLGLDTKTIINFAKYEQKIASITLDGFEGDESRNRALLAIRLGLDFFRIILPASSDDDVLTNADAASPISIKRLSQTDGRGLNFGHKLNIPGIGGAPGLLNDILKYHAKYFSVVGDYLQVIVSSQKQKLPCPALAEKWLNAAHWFGQACRAEADFIAIPSFAFALEILCEGGEESGIREMAMAVFEKQDNDIISSSGKSLTEVVHIIYNWRSRIAHGTKLAISHDLSDTRILVRAFTQQLIYFYGLKLGVYSVIPGADNVRSFLGWMKTVEGKAEFEKYIKDDIEENEESKPS